MEMAGIVCHTGANIIRQAREIVEQIGQVICVTNFLSILHVMSQENKEVITIRFSYNSDFVTIVIVCPRTHLVKTHESQCRANES